MGNSFITKEKEAHMLFLKDKGNKCLAEYVKDQTYCGDKHKDIKSKSYGFCVDDATTDLEACALMELIEEHEFKKFHVDVTAWLHFKGVVMARAPSPFTRPPERPSLKFPTQRTEESTRTRSTSGNTTSKDSRSLTSPTTSWRSQSGERP